jgi:hypothetical protein
MPRRASCSQGSFESRFYEEAVTYSLDQFTMKPEDKETAKALFWLGVVLLFGFWLLFGSPHCHKDEALPDISDHSIKSYIPQSIPRP